MQEIILILVFIGILYGTYILARNFIKGDAPYFRSFDSHLDKLKDNLKFKENAKFVDLGCGDGKVLRYFKKNFRPKSCIGYEIGWFPILISKIFRIFESKNYIKIYKKSFYNEDFKDADYIYIFLLQKQIDEIGKWIFDKIGEDTTIITSVFKFPNKQPKQIIKNKDGMPIFYIRDKQTS